MFMVYHRKTSDGSFLTSPKLVGVFSRQAFAVQCARMRSAEVESVCFYVKTFPEGGLPNMDGDGQIPFIALDGLEWLPGFTSEHKRFLDPTGNSAPSDSDDAGDLPF